jgi:hypothetical protein
MPIESRESSISATSAGPAALATRIRSGLSLAHGRAALEELPARLRAQLQVLADRVRRALDVPSHKEIAELARRVEELANKLDQLESDGAEPTGPSAAAVRDELRAELAQVTASAQKAAEAAAREAAAAIAEVSAKPAPASSKVKAKPTGASTKSAATRRKGGDEKAQRKTRSQTVANKTARKKPSGA